MNKPLEILKEREEGFDKIRRYILPDDENKKLDGFQRETIKHLLEVLIEGEKKKLQNEAPVDSFTGEPVATYGYEVVHNLAKQDTINTLKSLIKEL